MADQDGNDFQDKRVPGELFRATAAPRASSPAAVDLAEALGGLDRATRNFTRRLGEGQQQVEQARLADDLLAREASESAPAAQRETPEPLDAVEAVEAVETEWPRAEVTFESKMEEAEREARLYLEAAKHRADSLVQTMVGAVEHEAAEARREAEQGIRARWQQVEVDATRLVENARRVSSQMVSERQERISRLSDGISTRAEALTAGMDDAGRVQAQFDAFVRALSVTADQIAREPSGRAVAGEIRGHRADPRPSAMAA